MKLILIQTGSFCIFLLNITQACFNRSCECVLNENYTYCLLDLSKTNRAFAEIGWHQGNYVFNQIRDSTDQV